MSGVVLDASAVLALLQAEPGADRVEAVLADAAIGVFNQAEVIGHFVRLGAPIAEIRAMLRALPLRVVEADEALAWDAAALRSVTASAGLSLGDRFCLALAKRLQQPAYTADRAWQSVAADCGVDVVLVR